MWGRFRSLLCIGLRQGGGLKVGACTSWFLSLRSAFCQKVETEELQKLSFKVMSSLYMYVHIHVDGWVQ